ncbi:hypothetical protein [Streptomyces nojiriensis]|uniref:hypothetical protein n=1 Tax=Streptomyces nojiriensis TaxID=66374 RepID=UPI003653AFBF
MAALAAVPLVPPAVQPPAGFELDVDQVELPVEQWWQQEQRPAPAGTYAADSGRPARVDVLLPLDEDQVDDDQADEDEGADEFEIPTERLDEDAARARIEYGFQQGWSTRKTGRYATRSATLVGRVYRELKKAVNA